MVLNMTLDSATELGDGGYVVCYEMEDIKKKLGLGRNSLVT